MSEFWMVTNEFQRDRCRYHVGALDLTQKWRVTFEPWSKNRSRDQNALAWRWNNEIAKQGGEYTPDQIHQRAKLTYGVPILLAESPKFQDFWHRVSDLFPTLEEKTDLLMPMTPITSIMTTKQMARYLTDFSNQASQKYQLTDPALMGLDRDYL